MATCYLETRELTHRFSGNDVVLDNINIQVMQGSLYGFLGPNGAGKTTTLRLVLGLLKKQQGHIFVFGKPFERHRVEILKNVGSLIESSSVYGHLTAVENLRVLQKVHQCPTERIQESLYLVGLSDTGNKKADQFSLGMKQRLSIAMALIHHPSLLILDEPTNGLDPGSIVEVRELLRRLNQEHGTTIILSSHLLSEIEKLVTHVGIINKGRMIFQGTFDELKNEQQDFSCIVLTTNDTARTVQIVRDNNVIATVENGKIILPPLSREIIAEINRQLVHSGIEVYEISTKSNTLETIFMDMTKN